MPRMLQPEKPLAECVWPRNIQTYWFVCLTRLFEIMGPKKTPLGLWGPKGPSGVMGHKATPLKSGPQNGPLWGHGPQKDSSGAVCQTKWQQRGASPQNRPLWGIRPQKDSSGAFGPKKTPLGLLASKRLLWGFWPQKDPFGAFGPKKTPLGLSAPKRPLWGFWPHKDPSGAVGQTKWAQEGPPSQKKTPLGMLAPKRPLWGCWPRNQTKQNGPILCKVDTHKHMSLFLLRVVWFCIGKYMCTTMAQSCFYSNSNPTLHVQYS